MRLAFLSEGKKCPFQARNPVFEAVKLVIVMIAMTHGLVTWRWAIISFIYLMVLAWVVMFVVYQAGRALGFG
jgi:hypothetical protein